MCGRYTLAAPAGRLVETFDVGPITFDYVPRFNISPGQDAPVVAADGRGRRMGLLRWGLIPAWRDEPGRGFVNARAESAATRPSFREAFRRRRCLVPADGFYEWRGSPGAKQPYWIHPARGDVMAFAGLWETWRRPGEEPRHTFTILTTDANAEVREVHERMPVTVDPADFGEWLDRDTGPERLASMLRPAVDGSFALHLVSTRVNRVEEDDAELIAPLPE
jgi:putative SOS response-associated peptidase YedK